MHGRGVLAGSARARLETLAGDLPARARNSPAPVRQLQSSCQAAVSGRPVLRSQGPMSHLLPAAYSPVASALGGPASERSAGNDWCSVHGSEGASLVQQWKNFRVIKGPDAKLKGGAADDCFCYHHWPFAC